ncbi:putative zinc-type alcohol dehydrogenase-like protein [Paraburkholderia sp. RAU2J]|uniref:NAD(P)-dependent alcohol dehydrogenase n=1 Tax=Paraburkholderia sp. RAU2J TaxID=1938810 RepID=UPI000EB3443F|nr:NAD(P)-dependent alcohol dehydrogenase [Paraburkholderia sp. RAU2J]RKT20818.1 putative zinc-type alcohol dehydrogenase-like protein [Paraburkholderia sp. RAU2J]
MSGVVNGYAATAPDAELAPFQFSRRHPRADDVVIDILYCGVCHSDLHQARNDWGNTRYPVVPGHEIIGRVISVGGSVTRFRAEDVVGVGCLVDSCGDCGPCCEGEEQYCLKKPTPTYNGVDRRDGLPTYGGYSERIVVSEKFVLRIPDGLDARRAAPLLCAGITSYSPLRHWNVGAGHRVAVVGLGGLGHMGLKFAKAMGAEVTLITRNAGKEQEARRLGAEHVLVSSDPGQIAAAAGCFDLILDTIPSPHDLNPYVAMLRLNGTLALVGLIGPVEPPVHTGLLIMGRRSIAGSAIGGVAEIQEMLDFCAAHGINCDVEMIELHDINRAYQRLLKSDVRYRFVIDISSQKR